MRLTMAWRIVLAVLLAAVAIAALQWAVSARSSAGPGTGHAPSSEPLQPGAALPPALDPQLARPARQIVLADALERLPPEVVPVAEVLPSGRIAVRRRTPLPDRPLPPPLDVVGVVLPAPLEALSPAQRTALVDLLGTFAGGRALAPERVEGLGIELPPGELGALLRWVR